MFDIEEQRRKCIPKILRKPFMECVLLNKDNLVYKPDFKILTVYFLIYRSVF